MATDAIKWTLCNFIEAKQALCVYTGQVYLCQAKKKTEGNVWIRKVRKTQIFLDRQLKKNRFWRNYLVKWSTLGSLLASAEWDLKVELAQRRVGNCVFWWIQGNPPPHPVLKYASHWLALVPSFLYAGKLLFNNNTFEDSALKMHVLCLTPDRCFWLGFSVTVRELSSFFLFAVLLKWKYHLYSSLLMFRMFRDDETTEVLGHVRTAWSCAVGALSGFTEGVVGHLTVWYTG